MKSASSAASGSGRQQVQRPATDAKDEPRTGASMEIDEGKGGALPSVMEPNTRGRIAEKTFPAKVQTSSSAVAITIQEGIDRYREGSNEDRECRTGRLGQHHRAVCVRSGAQVRKTIKLPRSGASLHCCHCCCPLLQRFGAFSQQGWAARVWRGM